MSLDLQEPVRFAARNERLAPLRPHPIVDQARRRLIASMYLELRAVQCHFASGVLTLTGVLPSFYLKQISTSLVEHLDGVDRIENRVEVNRQRDPSFFLRFDA